MLEAIGQQKQSRAWRKEKELFYSLPATNKFANVIRQWPELRIKNDGYALLLPDSAKESQKYLRKFGEDLSFFSYTSKMVKKNP
jgi:hypothetical protein